MAKEVPKCIECGKELTPAEQLLNAIFAGPDVCSVCYDVVQLPKCFVCGDRTPYMLNGKPACKHHLEEARG